MKNNKIKIKLFKNVRVIVGDKEVDLSKIGNKLVALFELLVVNLPKEVSQQQIANSIWPDNEDPREVIKYNIFRLRKALDDFDELKGLNLIQTTEKGYKLSDEYEYCVDCLVMKEFHDSLTGSEIKCEEVYKKAEKIIKLYEGRFFVTSSSPLVLAFQAENYSSYFSGIVVMMSKYLINKNMFEEMMKLNYNAIIMEPFYEGLHYYYIKGLIELKDYHTALKHYDEIYERFFRELGIGLSQQFVELYNVIKEEEEEAEVTIEPIDIENDIKRSFKNEGAYYCSYETFKRLAEIMIKNAKREGKKIFLILFSFNKDISMETKIRISNRLKNYIEDSIRDSDIFTKIAKERFAVLVPCNEEENVFAIISRITTKFYKNYSSNTYRLGYSVREIKNDNQ